ncbi:MAG: arsenite methyltransferase [Anaerolineae bacterium]|nr:arsenite methyltransferase [Anaerolineae bacterium]NIN99155.1 arsenite methyltransferase [Anaerolineae bacterium]NIQ81996.1 arsenite methyltransferase [Anaerolineae bacterium]
MEKSEQVRIKEAVREYYAQAACADAECCAPESCCGTTQSVAQRLGYSVQELACLPPDVASSSMGCGNPLAFTEIREGDVVLDLGSGAGLDVILAAHEVGETGKVIGLDMTPEMIERAERSAERAGVGHIAEFRLGEMEDMPVDDGSVDLIISNCVVNLSPDKAKVFQEAFRVLKPGGRMLISDIVASNLPEALRNDMSAWAGCLAGALEESEYLNVIRNAGFEDVAVVDRVDAAEVAVDVESVDGLTELIPEEVTEAIKASQGKTAVLASPDGQVVCVASADDPLGRPKIHSVKVRAVKGKG